MEISRAILFQVFPDCGLEHVEITGGGRLRSVGWTGMRRKKTSTVQERIVHIEEIIPDDESGVSQGILTYPDRADPVRFVRIHEHVFDGANSIFGNIR